MPNDPRGLTDYIRETATKYGIDPDVALRVAQSEGLKDPIGDNGKSFGAFQLYTGGGVGNEFQRDTGLNPSDPANERATIDYALRRAAQVGWGPWHGAARVGIGQWQGIGGQGPPSDVVANTAPAATPSPAGGVLGGPSASAGDTVANLLGRLGGAAGAGRAPAAMATGQAPAFLQLAPMMQLAALPQMPAPYFAPRIQPRGRTA